MNNHFILSRYLTLLGRHFLLFFILHLKENPSEAVGRKTHSLPDNAFCLLTPLTMNSFFFRVIRASCKTQHAPPLPERRSEDTVFFKETYLARQQNEQHGSCSCQHPLVLPIPQALALELKGCAAASFPHGGSIFAL